jgi:protein-tyrosine phosphatase
LVDIHCHIVPAVDDGAESADMAEAMIAEAKSFGVTAIATTPHFVPGADDTSTIEHHSRQLKLVKPGDTQLSLSREVRVNSALLAQQTFTELTYGGAGKYILLELPSREVPGYLEQLLFNVRLDGITPILAHPERNFALIQNPRKLIDLVRAGMHLQLTTSSISGELGPTIESFSKALLKADLVSFIASDAHNVTTRPFSTWGPCLDTMHELAIEGDPMTTTNPRAVFDGKPIPPVELTREQERSFLDLMKSPKNLGEKKRKRFFFF